MFNSIITENLPQGVNNRKRLKKKTTLYIELEIKHHEPNLKRVINSCALEG